MNLYDLLQRIKKAETEADEVAILREAIEQLIKDCKPNIKLHACRFNDGDCVCDCYRAGQDVYQSNLLASIQPKEMK